MPEEQISVFNKGSKSSWTKCECTGTICYEKNMWLSFAPLRPENERGKQQRNKAG